MCHVISRGPFITLMATCELWKTTKQEGLVAKSDNRAYIDCM
jgi:hypothetical protein